MNKLNKKADAGNMEAYLYAFVGIVVAAFVFFIISDAIQTDQVTAFTTVNSANITGATTLATSGDLIDVTVQNNTKSSTVNETTPAGSYTLDKNARTITFTEDNAEKSGNVTVSGTYVSGKTYNATGNMITAMYNGTAQLPTAGTLIGIGVILAVVGAAIYGYRRMNGGF